MKHQKLKNNRRTISGWIYCNSFIHLFSLFFWFILVYLVFSKFQIQKENIFIHWSYLFLIIGVLLNVFYVTTLIGFTIPLRGLFCGIVFQLLLSKIRLSHHFVSNALFKFFIIFPFVFLGVLLTKKMHLTYLLLDTLVILFILLISSFVIGFFWLRKQNQAFSLMFALLHRGEFTLLLLFWAYIFNRVTLEFVAGAVLLSLVISFVSRLKLIDQVSKWS